jgi:diaminopimelate epimerase
MLNFYKYEGAGNDFVMINNLDGSISLSKEEVIEICDRHFGVGADGLILVEKSTDADLSRPSEAKADCFMNYYNSDGTVAEMCGNGARCTAKFYIEQTGSNKKEIKIDTRAGLKMIIVNNDDTYSVDMGIPNFSHADFPSESIILENLNFDFVSMGNPHAITFVDNVEHFNVKNIGPKIEKDSIFPNKINVEFVEKISDDYYKVRVWERGCGETLACGTGACAVFSIINKLSPRQGLGGEIILEFPGGKLYLSKNHEGHIVLRGSATFIFKGEN